jgi:transcriptional regulator with PAS, ATPase and Fis domain
MALVRLSAQIIENQMFAPEFPQDIVVCFHLKPEFIGTLYEGIAVFSPQGDFIAANRSALLQFGLDRFSMTGHCFATLFRLSLPKLLEQDSLQHHPVLRLQLQTGAEVFGRVWPGVSKSSAAFLPVSATSSKTSTVPSTGAGEHPLLHELEWGDRKMQALISKALKVVGHDIPIMIEGESGTGKELLARALQLAGPRCKGPFVPVNCASIPEGLIESELFGYQEGAFTGAKRKGHMGKIREADNGTLFLDEIGEMPLQLQARLLRVLQDHMVSPLGGSGSFRVELSVVCATNRRVRDAVAAGTFREDLYYRLNGLLLTLPRLKDREDRVLLARKILDDLAGAERVVSISPQVLRIFENHPWPGNIRQLHNVLRTALALLGTGHEISVEELSEDFVEQAEGGINSGNGSEDASAQVNSTALLSDNETRLISATLEHTGGNIAAAARMMGISRNTLYRKLRGQAAVRQ